MRLHRLGVLTLVAMAMATTGSAAELQVNLRSQFDWDSDRFRDGTKHVNAWSMRLSPEARLADAQRRYEYQLSYRPEFQQVLSGGVGEAFNHFVRAVGSVSVTRKTTIEFFDTLRQIESLRFVDNEPTVDEIIANDLETGDDRSLRNSASLTVTRLMTRRWLGSISGFHSFVKFRRRDRIDSETLGGEASMSYRLGPDTRAGLGLSATHQDFEPTGPQAGQTTDIYQAFASLSHSFGRGWSVAARGGPTLIAADTEDPSATLFALRFPTTGGGFGIDFSTCRPSAANPTLAPLDSCSFSAANQVTTLTPIANPFVPLTFVAGAPRGRSDETVDFFARFSISKNTDTWNANLSYTRSESDSAGVGTATVSDRVGARFDWSPVRHWRLVLTGGWSHRRSISDQLVTIILVEDSMIAGTTPASMADPTLMPTLAQTRALTTRQFNNSVRVTQWQGGAAITRQIRPNLTLAFELNYRRQESKRNTQITSNNYLGAIRLQYAFDAIRF